MISISIQKRIALLTELKELITSDDKDWLQTCAKAERENGWFTQRAIFLATENIANQFLEKQLLEDWIQQYPAINNHPDNFNQSVGIIMAGNIPLVGFHDFLCGFMAGFKLRIKLSQKDTALWKFIINWMNERLPEEEKIIIHDSLLKDCDAYIATGSNNSSRYFEQYFSKFPHIIRKNRTSVAVLTGNESIEELDELNSDIYTFFGLGCRNVTHIYVPENYDFENLLDSLNNPAMRQHNKYANNYDYHLAIYLLNKVKFTQHDSILLVENKEHFAPIASLHYSYYKRDKLDNLIQQLQQDDSVQAIIGNVNNQKDLVPFGFSQTPSLMQYADGVDVMTFLSAIIKS